MKNYVLTIKIPINAMDDMDIRTKISPLISAWEVIEKDIIVLEKEDNIIKLQEIFDNKAPRGVII